MRRILAGILILWALGFMWFAAALPQPAGDGRAEAIIVPTGAAGRIGHGLKILRSGGAGEMLVTGVDPEVKPSEFAAEFDVPMKLMTCCVTLGYAAVDTRGNASEAARWIEDREYRSIRLVTSDWHMRRAASELSRKLPDNVQVTRDAVASDPSLGSLFLEYHKLLASQVSRIWQR